LKVNAHLNRLKTVISHKHKTIFFSQRCSAQSQQLQNSNCVCDCPGGWLLFSWSRRRQKWKH